MFLRFQRIALDVSYGFGRNRSMFLIVVFLIKKSVYGVIFEKGLGKLEKDIIFKAVGLEKLDFHLWVPNIFRRCLTCMFIYL